MAQPTIVMAADYADTLITCRRAKNWLVLLLLMALLVQLTIFFAARYSGVLPAVNAGATTGPAVTAETLSPTPGRQMMQYLTSLTAYAGIVLSIVLALVLLATMNVMLIARLLGLAKVASAFVWCLILMGLLFPWQAFLNQTAATAGDLRIPGVLFTWSELVMSARFGVDDIPNAILKWSRFVAFPIIAIGLVLFIQVRSRRGIRLALGEQAPLGVMEVKA
jgi:hypothetical protein